MPDDLDQRACAATEHEQIAAVRITLETLLHQQRQALHALAHIRVAERDPYPRPKGSSQPLQRRSDQGRRCRRENAYPLAVRQVDDHRGALGSAGHHRIFVDHRFGEHRRRQCLGRLCFPRRPCIEQLAPPGVDQRRRNIVPSAHLGNARARRENLGQDLQPLLIALSPPPIRPRKHRHLTHRRLLSALKRARLRALTSYPRRAVSVRGVRSSRDFSANSIKFVSKQHRYNF